MCCTIQREIVDNKDNELLDDVYQNLGLKMEHDLEHSSLIWCGGIIYIVMLSEIKGRTWISYGYEIEIWCDSRRIKTVTYVPSCICLQFYGGQKRAEIQLWRVRKNILLVVRVIGVLKKPVLMYDQVLIKLITNIFFHWYEGIKIHKSSRWNNKQVFLTTP